jgi:hypothetical protein
MARDFYTEIDKVISEYENGKPWHTRDIDWAANRISWAWKWKKITEEQMEELADRAVAIMEGDV